MPISVDPDDDRVQKLPPLEAPAPATEALVSPLTKRESPQQEWSFRFRGPIAPIDDRRCPWCNAAALRECPRAGHPAVGCSSCEAAKRGVCHDHGGLAAALDMHERYHEIHPRHKASFERFVEFVRGYMATMPEDAKTVSVYASCYQEPVLDDPYANVHVEISIRK